MKKKPFLLLPLLILIFNSCIGISADIQMRRDGSFRLVLEYRISRMAETIGRLDGNEIWQFIPTGRADFERTIARIDGVRLVSFSSRERTGDIVNNITLDFKDAQALLNFLDPQGRRASINREDSLNRFNIILNEPVSSEINTDLMNLFRQAAVGYNVRISFSAEGQSSMMLTDGAGKTITPPPQAEVVLSGRNVSLEIETAEILGLKEGLGVVFAYTVPR